MSRRMIVPGLLAAGICAATNPLAAQHHHSGGHRHITPGHYDVIPGHYDRHGNHYDYHPPQTVYHPGRTIYHPNPVHPHPAVVYPATTYPRAVHPSTSYPRTVEVPLVSTPHVVARPVSQWSSFSHVDDLAMQLERQANTMCLEMHHNYQQNPGFNETYSEAYEILNTAKEIHAMEHTGNRDRMREAAARIDELFHHVQDDVRHWQRYGRRYFGQGGLRARMDDVEDTLHHLMQDMGVGSQYGSGHSSTSESAPPAVTPGSSNPFPGTLIGR